MHSHTSPNLAHHGPSISQALAPTLNALPRDASRPPQTQFTRSLQATFLRRLADSGEVRVAVSALPVSHQTVYRMRRACRAFAQGWDAALIVARQKAEDILASRAMHGVEEEVYYHGEVVATRRRYDARLLLAHLARLDRKAENADMAALAEQFDAVLEAFEGHRPTATDLENPEAENPDTESPATESQEDAEPLHETVDLTPVTLPEPLRETQGNASKTAASEKSSGPCNTWSMSQAKSEGEETPEPEDIGPEGKDPEEPPELEKRLRAMEAARPDDAPTLRELAQACAWEAERSGDRGGLGGAAPGPGAVEAAQLAAFEAGEPDWWLATPMREGACAGGTGA